MSSKWNLVWAFTFLSEYVILTAFSVFQCNVCIARIVIVVNCGGLTSPLNGNVSVNGTVYESTATYMCYDGYILMGEHHRHCLANGSWSHKQPSCERKISLTK